MDTNKIKNLLVEVKNGTKTEDEVSKEIMKDYGTAISNEQAKTSKAQENLNNLQKQLDDANNEIKSYKDMDIDSIKQSAADWEDKYNKLIQEQKDAKEKSIRDERVNEFFKDTKFSSEMAKKGIIAEFDKKDFKYDEETKSFQGATEWLNNLKEQDKGSFLSDVANPKFTTVPKAPTQSSTNDELRKIMGLGSKENK
ncbi:MAG: hypothetical protein IJ568_05350 [Bacilli bacterium]|nr:hypothetical protein [Bacilli bacterium]